MNRLPPLYEVERGQGGEFMRRRDGGAGGGFIQDKRYASAVSAAKKKDKSGNAKPIIKWIEKRKIF